MWYQPGRIVSVCLMFFVALATLPSIAIADHLRKIHGQTLVISSYRIDNVLDEGADSPYSMIIREVSRRSGIPIKIEYFPPARAITIFDDGEADCVVPIDRLFFDRYANFYQTRPLNLAKAYIFTRHADKMLNRVQDLKGLTVGAQQGVQHGKEIDEGLELVRVQSLASLVKMLNQKRLDAFIGYLPDMYEIYKGLGEKPHQHDLDNPVVIHRDSLTCKVTPQNRAMIEGFDKTIADLLKNGFIQSVLN